MKRAVLCVTETPSEAEEVVRALHRGGVPPCDVSVVAPRRPDAGVFGDTGAFGGARGFLQGGGAMSVTGLGEFIAAGPIRSAFTPASGSAGCGGVTGSLVVLGIPEREARWCTRSMESGRVLVSVHVTSLETRKRAESLLRRSAVPLLFDDTQRPRPLAATHRV